jgi:hypothetical protein
MWAQTHVLRSGGISPSTASGSIERATVLSMHLHFPSPFVDEQFQMCITSPLSSLSCFKTQHLAPLPGNLKGEALLTGMLATCWFALPLTFS